jgi:EAL domain-containing protein (putative c-di-GMP-specific phosphodiesterase class I)
VAKRATICGHPADQVIKRGHCVWLRSGFDDIWCPQAPSVGPGTAAVAGLGLDDVGAGGADWHRLARLPADVVKVDRSVPLNAAASARGRAVLASLVQLLAELDVACVVEGVETAEQVALLEELLALHPGLAGQGWHFGRPSPTFPVPASTPRSQ